MKKIFSKLLRYIFSLLGIVTFLSATAQEQAFTKEDSLRGTITPEREWWDLTYYHLAIKVEPEAKRLEGSVLVSYKVLKPGKVMQIDLQPPLTIQKITQDNETLSFTKAGKNAYLIQLVKDQAVGSVGVIIIYYSGNPRLADNPPWGGGFQFTKDNDGNDFVAMSCQGIGASSWWPCKEHSYDEPDSLLMSITVPKNLIDVSNGRLRKTTENSDGTKTFDWFVSNPINNYGVNVNIANYTHFSDTLNGAKGVLDLDFYVLPYNLEKAKKQFSQAKLMLRAFEYWFGPYPFYEDGYKLVEVPYLGMEHQSSVTYGNGFQNGYKNTDLSGSGWGLKWDFIIIHESGHEWFANSITYRDVADMWIHEGFTNYSETLFTEYYYGKEAGIDYVTGTRAKILNDKPIIGPYGVAKRGSSDMYYKGGNMLHTIRSSIGNDSLFREILRGLNKTFYHQTVTTKQIEDFISRNAGIDFSKVFDQYLRSVKVPQLEYYVKKNKVYYRWANVVDGFEMQLNLPETSSIRKIKPTTSWKKSKAKNPEGLIDKKFLERMYYIKVVSTTRN